MADSMKKVYNDAKQVARSIPNEQLKRFRQRLISDLEYGNYDGLISIILNLSSYSGVNFSFTDELIHNFRDNKSILYTFINALVADPI